MSETDLKIQRQMYQMHQKGYEKMAEALKDSDVNLNLKIEVNGAVIKDIKLEDEE